MIAEDDKYFRMRTDPHLKLSENFELWEFTASAKAKEYNIPNNPALRQLAALTRLAKDFLQPIRNHYGQTVKISSGYRSRTLNMHPSVGGSGTSAHCEGLAVDFTIANVNLIDAYNWIAFESSLPFDQVILEDPPNGWIHLGIRPAAMEPRGEKLLATWKVAGNKRSRIYTVLKGPYKLS